MQVTHSSRRCAIASSTSDFAPLADVYQGGAMDQSRMFGTTPGQVITYAGAFLDGLQQNGVEGTLSVRVQIHIFSIRE